MVDNEQLKKAYEAVEMLRSLGLPVNDEQLGKLHDMEVRYIKEFIIPVIHNTIAPLTSRTLNDWEITALFDPDEGLKYVIERKNTFAEHTVTYVSGGKRTNCNLTKYSIDGGEPLNKRRFVWAVVKKYVEQHPDVTYDELVHSFPPSLSHSPLHGVFQPLELIEKKILKQPDLKKRFMLGPDEIITLSDGIQITVYNQWGTNFDGFLRVAQRLFEVKSYG